MEPGTVVTVKFEDCGQDFLEWDICNGVVIDCRPFQASVWVNCRVMGSMEKLKVGQRLHFKTQEENLGLLRLNYPITDMRQSAISNLIPCFLCGEDFPKSLALETTLTDKANELETFPVFLCPICAHEAASTEEG